MSSCLVHTELNGREGASLAGERVLITVVDGHHAIEGAALLNEKSNDPHHAGVGGRDRELTDLLFATLADDAADTLLVNLVGEIDQLVVSHVAEKVCLCHHAVYAKLLVWGTAGLGCIESGDFVLHNVPPSLYCPYVTSTGGIFVAYISEMYSNLWTILKIIIIYQKLLLQRPKFYIAKKIIK